MTYTIMLRSNTTFIKVGNFSNVSFRYNSPVSPMPLPEEDSTENMLVKLEGNSMNLGLSWMLIEEKENMVGTDIKRVNNKSAFVQLLESIHAIDGIKRIRFTSPHPTSFGIDLIEAFQSSIHSV